MFSIGLVLLAHGNFVVLLGHILIDGSDGTLQLLLVEMLGVEIHEFLDHLVGSHQHQVLGPSITHTHHLRDFFL